MNSERLVIMANDIGNFFASEPDLDRRIAGVLEHLQRYWDPRMRRQIIACSKELDSKLSEHVRAAVLKLESSNS